MRSVTAVYIIAFSIILAVIFCASKESISEVFYPSGANSDAYRSRETSLLDFVETHVMGHQTERLADTNKNSKSNSVLSESTGLLMSYYVESEKAGSFSKEYSYLTNNLMVDNEYIKWKTGNDIFCNAAIDDLRIVRALLNGYRKFGKRHYYDLAGFIQEGIFRKQVIDNNIYEFYDWKNDCIKPVIPLCYIDLYTMDRLRIFNNNWLKVADRGLATIKSGRIYNNSPFFYKYYDYNTGRYELDEEYSKEKGICITYSLYTVLHLSEVNEDTSFFTSWLRDEIEKGRLYAWYNPETLLPVCELESTAVYALAAVYSKTAGENDLYNKLIDRMLEFMVIDKDSPYYGGFGNCEEGQFHSFDNLTALWALGMTDR